MSITGNPKHVHVNYSDDQAPSRGPMLNIHGWAISEMGYGVLVAKFGKEQADKHCRWLAERDKCES